MYIFCHMCFHVFPHNLALTIENQTLLNFIFGKNKHPAQVKKINIKQAATIYIYGHATVSEQAFAKLHFC